jgi:diguanylate cyclase (GGDEF)-like protein/PAS domain S-box-containing protein
MKVMTGQEIPMALDGTAENGADNVSDVVPVPVLSLAEGADLPDALFLSPEKLLLGFEGPAVLLDRRGKLLAQNEKGQALAILFSTGGDPGIRGLLAGVIGGDKAVSEKLDLPEVSGGGSIEVSFVPLKDDAGASFVAVLSRETTMERNFINALLTSRQLFKDLVSCSADFAWETDKNGNFKFVSEKGVLGYTAHKLNGNPPRNLIHHRHDKSLPFPFDSEVPLEDAEVWLRHADGTAACLLISSVPVHSETGEWLGARGVARDMTDTRERDQALERERNRNELLNTIVDAIRNEVEPGRMLGTAAEAIAAAVGARHCWVMRGDTQQGFMNAAEYGGTSAPIPKEASDSVSEVMLHGDPRGVVERQVGMHLILTAACRYRGEVNGAIAIARGADQADWTEDAKALLAGVAARVGIAMEQITIHEKLERLSRVDELTGLYNRRAFYEDLEGRLAHHRRTGRSGALVYVDLDNFKMVNDIHGHSAGDDVLMLLSDILKGGSRIGDLTARLGGDEFALWTEDTDEEGAMTKARLLMADAEQLKSHSGDEEHPLGISVGIAVSDPASAESMNDMIARADGAMYDVKHSGKGGYAVMLPGGNIVRGT